MEKKDRKQYYKEYYQKNRDKKREKNHEAWKRWAEANKAKRNAIALRSYHKRKPRHQRIFRSVPVLESTPKELRYPTLRR